MAGTDVINRNAEIRGRRIHDPTPLRAHWSGRGSASSCCFPRVRKRCSLSMVNCAVVGCSNRSDVTGRKKRPTSARFFSLPKVIENQCERTKTLSAQRRRLWLARIKRANFNHESPNVRVCGVHFIKGEPSNLFDETNPDWAPSLSLGHGTRHADSARHDRRVKILAHKRRADVEATAVASEASPRACPDSPQPPQAEEVSADENETGIAVQTDMTMQDIQALEQHSVVLNEHLYTLQKEKEQLEVTEDSLKSCEAKVRLYTGMPNFAVLFAVFEPLASFISHNVNNKLTKFQEFVLFMMKLKVNLQNADLAFRFNISDATVSRIFDKWLHVAYCRLKDEIIWPTRDALQKTMPQAFYDSFGANVAVIIDCFEIKIERPSSYLRRCETWSQYKGSNTAKFLIGIAPQGVVTYISEGWGGRALWVFEQLGAWRRCTRRQGF
ncbi:uncharacterized protein LOC144122962 [Amblyomma americanum]